MKKQKKQKSKFATTFDLRHLPMDLGRLVCLPCPLLFRVKRVRPDGTRYRGRLRGGHLLVSNHVGFADPFWMGSCFWYRRIFFLTAEHIMERKLQGLLLRGMGCIRIDRNISDLEAVRRAIDTVKEGHCLTVFAQGGIDRSGDLTAIKSGAILMGLRSGAPIVPMYTRRRKHWYERQVVVIGEAFRCSDFCTRKMPSMGDIEQLSSILLSRMEECKNTYDAMKGPIK